MEISLAPETIFHLGHFAITNSIFTGGLVTLFLLLAAFLLRINLKPVGGRIQTAVEMVYEWLLDTCDKVIGRRDVAREIFPYVITLFWFIVFANLSGLIPGAGALGIHGQHHGKDVLIPLFRAPSTDLNLAFALALLSMGYVQYLGLKYAGFTGYIKKFVNIESPLGFFVGILELFGEFTRIISFAFRLFGNIFAGEVLLAVIFYLTFTFLPFIPILPLPFFFLELFVGLMQAFIFCFLTIVFIALAITSHDTEGHSHGGEELTIPDLAAKAEIQAERNLFYPKHSNRK